MSQPSTWGIVGFVEGVPDENDVGVAFYESSGFRRIETTHNDHFGVQQYEYRKQLYHRKRTT